MLTGQEKLEIINDFTAWTGGFTPDECERSQIGLYINLTLNVKFSDRKEEVLDLLMHWGGMMPE